MQVGVLRGRPIAVYAKVIRRLIAVGRGNDQFTARLQNAQQMLNKQGWIGYMLDHFGSDDAVECMICKRQSIHFGDDAIMIGKRVLLPCTLRIYGRYIH